MGQNFYEAGDTAIDLNEARKSNKLFLNTLQQYIGISNRIASGSGSSVNLFITDEARVVFTGKTIYEGEKKVNEVVTSWNDVVAIHSVGGYTLNTTYVIGILKHGNIVSIGPDKKKHLNDASKWRNIIAVSAKLNHIVGLKTDGTVVAAGNNSYGQLNVSGWYDIIAISTSDKKTIGLKADGSIVSTGDNKINENLRDIAAIYGQFCVRNDGLLVGFPDDISFERGELIDIISKWDSLVNLSYGTGIIAGVHMNGTVSIVYSGERNNPGVREVTNNWTDIVSVYCDFCLVIAVKRDGTMVHRTFDSWHSNSEISTRGVKLFSKLPVEYNGRPNLKQSREWKQQGKCSFCGGELGGFFSTKCMDCGEKPHLLK